jgi:hypothetical protein
MNGYTGTRPGNRTAKAIRAPGSDYENVAFSVEGGMEISCRA